MGFFALPSFHTPVAVPSPPPSFPPSSATAPILRAPASDKKESDSWNVHQQNLIRTRTWNDKLITQRGFIVVFFSAALLALYVNFCRVQNYGIGHGRSIAGISAFVLELLLLVFLGRFFDADIDILSKAISGCMFATLYLSAAVLALLGGDVVLPFLWLVLEVSGLYYSRDSHSPFFHSIVCTAIFCAVSAILFSISAANAVSCICCAFCCCCAFCGS